MFGKVPPKQEECPPPRRSRPQRRPVVERFLKKNMEDNSDRPDVVDRTCDKQTRCTKEVSKSDILAMKTDSVLSYCCIEDCMKNFPQEEMEEVLRKLRERNMGLKGYSNVNCLCDKKESLPNKSLSHLIDKLKMSSNLLEQNKELKKSNIFYNKNSDYCDSKLLFKQALRLNKESSNKKTDQNFKTMTPLDKLSPQPDVHHKVQFGHDTQNLHPKDQASTHHLLANKLNLLQSSNYYLQTKNDSHLFHVPDQKSPEMQNRSESHPCDPNRTLSPAIPPRYGSVNIKKCGAFLMKSDSGELSGDERDISDSVFSPADTFDDDDVSCVFFFFF